MRIRPIHTYVAGMAVAAAVSLLLANWSQFLMIPRNHMIWGFGLLAALGLLSEATAFSHRIAREAGHSSLVFLPLVVCVILFGPAAAALFIAVTAIVAEFLIRRKEPLRCLFNTAQYTFATALAGWVFHLLGGRPLSFDMVGPEAEFLIIDQLLPIAAFGVVLFFFNHLFVGFAIALAHRQGIARVLRRTFAKSGFDFFHDLLVLPIAIPVAWLYFELAWVGLVTSIGPLTLIRYAYLSKYQLEVANRDLLRALVKAIEIRDPYTSGHALRVQKLAQAIGRHLGLGEGHLADLSAAALLHDIGKIEVVYEEIIKKPGSLSEEEMRVIQSHVTRGVEILTSLSSVNPRIIRGVKYHHEKYDGTGYPDGLVGTAIPIEGRIIKTCDAIDAMLSDRSYRKALSREIVEEELLRCAGEEFDPVLVDIVLQHDLVSRHQKTMRLERALGPRDVMAEDVTEVFITEQS
jgi:putative nucleotidyltransferase with HDIG domain